jgi:hypothetical protein
MKKLSGDLSRRLARIALAALAISLAACASLDVVQKDAERALAEVRELTGDEIISPDGGARFWREDGSVRMEVNAAPLVAAGLRSGEEVLRFEGSAERDNLGFHTQMGHYNYDLGEAAFEWAKDMSANDKDIVFVLDPEPLIDAGLDPDAVEGWTYAEVPVMRDGKEIQVWKLLKPFDLK